MNLGCEELNGEDTLEFGCREVPAKGDRLLWQVDYAVTSSLASDVAALQNGVAGIDGNLSVATSVQVVESAVTTAINDLDELAGLDF